MLGCPLNAIQSILNEPVKKGALSQVETTLQAHVTQDKPMIFKSLNGGLKYNIAWVEQHIPPGWSQIEAAGVLRGPLPRWNCS